jgi:hypothetical protein
MKSVLIPLLLQIAQATSPSEYLSAQDRALPAARTHYTQLKVEAETNPDRNVRIESVGLIALLEQPDTESFLLKRHKEDKDPMVSEHARVLLFHFIVARNARASGQMTEQELQKAKETSRRLRAEALFEPPKPKSGRPK